MAEGKKEKEDWLRQGVAERQKPQIVTKLQFGMMTGLDVCKMAHLNVTSKVGGAGMARAARSFALCWLRIAVRQWMPL